MTWLTLGVSDLERAHAFTETVLGLPSSIQEVSGMRNFAIRVEELTVCFMERSVIARNVQVPLVHEGFSGVVLSTTLGSRQAADEAVARAAEQGLRTAAPVLHPWGIYSGFVTDAEGYVWEIGYAEPSFGSSTQA